MRNQFTSGSLEPKFGKLEAQMKLNLQASESVFVPPTDIEEQNRLAKSILARINGGEKVSQEEKNFMLEVRARQTKEDRELEHPRS